MSMVMNESFLKFGMEKHWSSGKVPEKKVNIPQK